MIEEETDSAASSCNIGTRGRWIRGTGGLICLGSAIALWFGIDERFWSIGLFLAGIFMIYEAARGWCAIRALGIKTPF